MGMTSRASKSWLTVNLGASTATDTSFGLSEAHRIRLAHLFDPVLAGHTSVIEPLDLHAKSVFAAPARRAEHKKIGASF
jgi:hypothetical protein